VSRMKAANRLLRIAAPFVFVVCASWSAIAAGGSDAVETSTTRRAVIVLVGPHAADPNLEALLVELLSRKDITPRFVHQEALLSQQILDSVRGDPSLWVFIHFRRAGAVDLYFRDPTGERFLLREFRLNNGLDDVGCEGLGQIVETAAVTLLSSDEGLNRDQAKALIERHKPEPVRDSVTQRAVMTRSQSLEIFGWLSAKYDVSFCGADIGFEHGPGLELGLGGQSHWLWRGRLAYARYFPQTVHAGPITTDLTTQKLSALFDIGFALSHNGWLVFGIGAGTDTTRIAPLASNQSDVVLSRARADWAPYSLGEARYEFAGRGFALGFVLHTAVPLVDTHYDVTQPNGTERLATPARIQPGAALVFALRPVLSGRSSSR
jgi:hypothetical protein